MNTATLAKPPEGRQAPPPSKSEEPAKDTEDTGPAEVSNTPLTGKHKALRIGGAVIGAVALIFGIRWGIQVMNTVSTDDAYVNSYVTFVAPRVAGQVTQVLVEDNNRVKKGDVLVRIDPVPYEIIVAQKQAALDVAEADLELAKANTQALIAQTRGDRFKLEHSMQTVDDAIAQIRQRVATLEKERATLMLAQEDFRRAQELFQTKVISQQEMDQKQEALGVAEASVNEALENLHESRVALGLPAEPATGQSLDSVPANLDQTYSSVRESLADLLQSAAQLGIAPSSLELTPQQVVTEFLRRDPDGDVDKIYAHILQTAPAIRQAEAAVEQAQKDLDAAKLNLSYTTIVSEIDGVVTRRNVNPGDYLQVGQSLMAVRSLDEIWVDANFKETQLRDLRIGQPVTLHVDMYGGAQEFQGRISGFTMGTGSTLALLPPENATGNFVKVVQRLPVRIDLVNYDPDNVPLFVGTSVEPEVHINEKPTGPNAGHYLQEPVRLPQASQP